MSDQELIERAASAVYIYGRAFIRKGLEERRHRAVSQEEVETFLLAWIPTKQFECHVTAQLQALIQDPGNPIRDQASGDIYRLAELYFTRLTNIIDRPRGRPRKPKGLIGSAMLKGKAARREEKKIKLDELERKFAAAAAGKKLRAFADAENLSGDPAAALRYIDLASVPLASVMSRRLPKGFLEEFCQQHGLKPRAFRKRLERTKSLSPSHLGRLARKYAGNSGFCRIT